MPPKLDSEVLLMKEGLIRENLGLHLGFMVQYPWGSTAGSSGNISELGYEAMSRGRAEKLISDEAAEHGLEEKDFELLPIAAMFVK